MAFSLLGLDLKEKNRVVFNEITKDAVKAAFKEPRTIDVDLVDAQQARRTLRQNRWLFDESYFLA